MSLPQSRVFFSVEEYLEIERQSEERHEYLDGVIYSMAGESPAHGTISTNLVATIHTQLSGTPCRVFSKDTKVLSGPTPRPGSLEGLFSYPDLVVVCGELKFHDEHHHVILNPTVIIEVSSPFTETFDRGEKWNRYQTWLPTLKDYLMVAQTRPQIEHYERQDNGRWQYTSVTDLEGTVDIASINCALKLADVYDRITFNPEEIEAPPTAQ